MEEVMRIQCGNGNCYIVANGTDAILVDTCRTRWREKILAACKPYTVRLIVLTHGHLDHIQNAAYLSRQLGAPIAMHRADIPLLADNLAQALEAKTLPGKLMLALSVKSFGTEPFEPFTPGVFLDEGDTLLAWGINARVISVPGHTDGSIALDVAGTSLIVGDALMNMFYPTVSMLYHDRRTMLLSAEKISRLGKRTIYFGHGIPVPNRQWTKAFANELQ